MNGTAPVPVAIVFAGVEPVAPTLRERLPAMPTCSPPTPACGVADALGLHVDHLVGDLDSADPARSTRRSRSGTTVDRHPAEKDATDLELAFDAAVARGARRVVLVDGGGDRLDHLLGNLLLLASPTLAGVEAEAFCGTARGSRSRVAAIRRGDRGTARQLRDAAGGRRPRARHRHRGIALSARDEELAPGTTRGVSNELVAGWGSVQLSGGNAARGAAVRGRGGGCAMTRRAFDRGCAVRRGARRPPAGAAAGSRAPPTPSRRSCS